MKKSTSNSDLRFGPEHSAAFLAISRDRNPLHTDVEYSRRTQFGRPVMYGVGGILAGLGIWAKGRLFALNSLRARFDKPLFTGESYSIQMSEAGEEADFKITKGGQIHTRVRFVWREAGMDRPSPAAFAGNFHPLTSAREWRPVPGRRETIQKPLAYEPDWNAAAAFENNFGLKISQFPREQLAALLGSSYLVGMEIPGQQALFVELDLKFATAPSAGTGFEFRNLEAVYDDRFNLVTISGTGTGIDSVQISASCRPKPVSHALAEVQSRVGTSAELKGKNVFISGASRGFGEVLAKSFALRGAGLALNYRHGSKEIRELENELHPFSPQGLFCVQGDAGCEKDCARMQSEVFSRFSQLDFLVCNAFPPIEAKPFLAQTPREFLDFLHHGVAMSSQLLNSFLPHLKDGATILYISTIMTLEPREQFSHYVAAKAAGEALIRGLANEFNSFRFVIVRPPRMLTDQTNLPFDRHPAGSAIEVAARLMKMLLTLDANRNFFELNL
jgi:NAD(P)-dependent dehydrogenase (short-subunit alcohol dehydrogenase family)